MGWFLALVLGVFLGLLRASLPKTVRNNFFFNFFLEIPRFPPPIAWIPFIILLLGIGEWSAYTIVFIGAFPPIFTSTYEAAINIPEPILRFTNSLQLPRWKRQFHILMMYISPEIFTSLKVAAAMAWMCVIAAEMISGQSGLGYAIQLGRLNMQYDEVLFCMLAIGSIGYFIHWVLNMSESLLLPWSLKGKF